MKSFSRIPGSCAKNTCVKHCASGCGGGNSCSNSCHTWCVVKCGSSGDCESDCGSCSSKAWNGETDGGCSG